MNEVTPYVNDTLPSLIDKATAALESARTSGEVLEARDMARTAYDAAKSAGRMAKAKSAHDSLIGDVHRAQAHALSIRARAEMRLAEEYDAAQEGGEVARHGQRGPVKDVVAPNVFSRATSADLGLRRDEIHEARQFHKAEQESPGIVQGAIDGMVERGEEPTRAGLRREVEIRKAHVSNNSGNNEWYTPSPFIEAARAVMGGIDLDPASSEIANRTVRATQIFTEQDDGLAQDWPVCRIWMNPPYAQPLMSQFAERISREVERGSEAVILTNNATETGWFQRMGDVCSAICFPKTRIRFIDTQGNPSGAPLQGQAIIYCGPNADVFHESFSGFGLVVRHG